MKKILDHIVPFLDAVEEVHERRGAIPGLLTSFAPLDAVTGGLHPGDLIVIASLPGMGKTTFALNVAEHVALTLKRGVGIFSLATNASEIVRLLMCAYARVNVGKMQAGFLGEHDFPRLTVASANLAESPIYIEDTPGLTLDELLAAARDLKEQREDLGLIVIDALHFLLAARSRTHDDRRAELAHIAVALKNLARELNVPVMVLARLDPSRGLTDGEGSSWGDLRELGPLQFDADLIGLLMRLEYGVEDEETRESLRGKATLLIAKNGNGTTGEVNLTFLKEYARFEARDD